VGRKSDGNISIGDDKESLDPEEQEEEDDDNDDERWWCLAVVAGQNNEMVVTLTMINHAPLILRPIMITMTMIVTGFGFTSILALLWRC